MKKFFSYFGIGCLIIVSFFYTEQTVSVVKEYDEIMITLKEYSISHKKEAKDATIEDNKIIPGLKGYEIDINKSYSKMRRYGKFNSSLIEYSETKPSISIENNLDKYIINGNLENRIVSISFLLDENSNIDNVLNILKKENINGNFFITSDWLDKNSKKIANIIENGHVIGMYDNFTTSLLWMDTIVKKVGKQKQGYCYFDEENSELLNMCALYGNYSIYAKKIDNNFYNELKQQLKSGSIFVFPISNELEQNLNLIINYIKSKGFIIKNLNELIKE